MANISFKNIENIYLSILAKEDERILWNGHPGPMDIKTRTIPIIVGLFLGFGALLFWGISNTFVIEWSLIFIIILLNLGIAGVILFGYGIAPYIKLETSKNTDYFISSKKIIKIQYGYGYSYGYRGGYYAPPKDLVLSLDLDNIKLITFDPLKPNDTQFMRITFTAENRGIRSYELSHGELISRPSINTQIQFKSIEDWKKARQILSDLVPNAIQWNEKL